MSLAACAAAHSLTGTLVSETASYPPTSPTSASYPASVTASVNGYGTTTTVQNTYTTTTSCSSSSTAIYTPPYTNFTYTTTTSSPPTQFTGGAVQAVLGFPVLALAAAGAVFAL
jgi:hypothetical protein